MLTAIDPTTGEVVREVASDPPATVEAKLAAAAAAYGAWRQASFAARGDVLRAVAARLRAARESLAALLTEEMGKVTTEALGEVDKSAHCAEHFADHAARYLAPEHLAADASRSYVQYLPLGTVLGILPWNSPYWLALRVCAPALMAGNTVLLKHDPHVPGCAEAIADVFRVAGAPRGLLDVLLLETERVEPVLRDRRIAAVSFTGSTRGGAAVAAIAASEVKPAVLELGGSDPAVVLADADLDDAAATIARMRILAAGQSCIAAKRIIVEDAVHDQFLELLAGRLGAFRQGDPRDPASEVGPLARSDLRANLHRQVRASISEGARCLLGGTLPDGPGWFYPVTLLAEVTPAMTAFREETFGPLAVVCRARDAEDAIALANATDYGLAGSVWTTAERGEAMASRIEAGQVAVNGIVKTDPRLPSGGIKRSGYGKELGPHGIREFVNAQQVWVGPRRDG